MYRALVPAAVFGTLGLALGYMIVSIAPGGGWKFVAIMAGLAAFAIGLVLWRWLSGAAGAISARRGALIGALTGLLAHPVAWHLMILLNYLAGTKPLWATLRSIRSRACGAAWCLVP